MTPTAALVLPPEPRYLGPSLKYTSSYACPVCGEGLRDTHTAKVGISHTEIRSEAKRHVETTGHTVLVSLRGPAGLDEFRLGRCGAAHCKLAGEVLSAAGEGVCHHHATSCDSDHAPAKLDADGWCRACDPITTSPQVAAPEAASASVEGGGFESPASISQKLLEAPGAYATLAITAVSVKAGDVFPSGFTVERVERKSGFVYFEGRHPGEREITITYASTAPMVVTRAKPVLAADDPRRFSFTGEASYEGHPFGPPAGNHRIRSHRGPRVAAGRR